MKGGGIGLWGIRRLLGLSAKRKVTVGFVLQTCRAASAGQTFFTRKGEECFQWEKGYKRGVLADSASELGGFVKKFLLASA